MIVARCKAEGVDQFTKFLEHRLVICHLHVKVFMYARSSHLYIACT
jgi:hypothetical protein